MYVYRPSEGHGLAHDPFNAIVAPRPIGWISTLSATGARNLAPYSFFNAFNYRPPIIGFASIGYKDSVRNGAVTGEFVWNLASRPQAEAMNVTAATVDADQDEFDLAGLTGVDSLEVAPQRVAGAPVAFECRVSQHIQLTTHTGELVPTWLTLGEVVAVHIEQSLIVDGVFDTVRAQPVLRAGGPSAYFGISEAARFDLSRPA